MDIRTSGNVMFLWDYANQERERPVLPAHLGFGGLRGSTKVKVYSDSVLRPSWFLQHTDDELDGLTHSVLSCTFNRLNSARAFVTPCIALCWVPAQ
jgi:hypothetical protein